MEQNDGAGFLIAKIHQLSGRILSKLMKKYDITEINPSQGRILYVLWQKDNISIQELAKRTSLGKQTLTSMLDRLEKNDFIYRETSASDKRKTMIRRTKKDISFQGRYDNVTREIDAIFYKDFLQNERVAFETYLRRIFANLDQLK